MYESPINQILGELQMHLEGETLKAVQNVGIDVNKEELIKALQYDREQYGKGYKDGYEKAIEEVLEVVKRTYHNFSGYDLEFMTKYGNKNASQQAESYSTMMMYEIAGEFDDLIELLEQLKEGAE